MIIYVYMLKNTLWFIFYSQTFNDFSSEVHVYINEYVK